MRPPLRPMLRLYRTQRLQTRRPRLRPRPLMRALLVALAYCLLYLNVLDPRGLHFYIIFTPRTAWCAISYALVLSAYYAFYQAWNHVLAMHLL